MTINYLANSNRYLYIKTLSNNMENDKELPKKEEEPKILSKWVLVNMIILAVVGSVIVVAMFSPFFTDNNNNYELNPLHYPLIHANITDINETTLSINFTIASNYTVTISSVNYSFSLCIPIVNTTNITHIDITYINEDIIYIKIENMETRIWEEHRMEMNK